MLLSMAVRREEDEKQVKKQVEDQVDDQVEEQVEEQVEKKKRTESWVEDTTKFQSFSHSVQSFMFVDETADDVEKEALEDKVDEAVEEDNVDETEPAAGGSKETDDVKTKHKKIKKNLGLGHKFHKIHHHEA